MTTGKRAEHKRGALIKEILSQVNNSEITDMHTGFEYLCV